MGRTGLNSKDTRRDRPNTKGSKGLCWTCGQRKVQKHLLVSRPERLLKVDGRSQAEKSRKDLNGPSVQEEGEWSKKTGHVEGHLRKEISS